MTRNTQSSHRIEYIDCIKGFTILWVVLYHMEGALPAWGQVDYRMPLFFFMSGLFFRQRPFKTFLVRRLNTLIVPFLFFYLLSVLVCGIKHEMVAPLFPSIDYQPLRFEEYALSITRLTDIFLQPGLDEHAPLGLNVPLWFLLALFQVQLIYYGMKRGLRKSGPIIAVCCLCYILSVFLRQHQVVGPFYLPRVMEFLIYYGLGNMLGQKLVDRLDNLDTRHLFGAFLALSGVLGVLGLLQSENLFLKHILLNLNILIFIPIVFIFFKLTCRFPLFRMFGFFGRNSLVVLSLHSLILSVFLTIIHKFLPLGVSANLFMCYAVGFILTITICFIAIRVFNRFFPRLVGKKELIRVPRQFDNNHK